MKKPSEEKTAMTLSLRRFSIFALTITSILLYSSWICLKNKNNLTVDKWNLYDFFDEDKNIEEEFAQYVDFENFKGLKFVPVVGRKAYSLSALEIYLVNKNNNIEYQFPDFLVNGWTFYELKDVVFQDLNKDKKTDIILFASYLAASANEISTELAEVPF